MDLICSLANLTSACIGLIGTSIGNISVITSLLETYLGGALSALCGGGCSTIIDQITALLGPPAQSLITAIGSIARGFISALGV